MDSSISMSQVRSYKMTTYEIRQGLQGDILVKIDEDGTESFVPMDEGNSDYQRYLNPDQENGTIS